MRKHWRGLYRLQNMGDSLILSSNGGLSYNQIADGQAEPTEKKIFCYIGYLIMQRAKEAFEDLDATYMSLHPDSTMEDAWSTNTEVEFDLGMIIVEHSKYRFRRTPFEFLHIRHRDDTYFCDTKCIKTNGFVRAETRGDGICMSIKKVDLSPILRSGILSNYSHLDKDALLDSLALHYSDCRTEIELFRTMWRTAAKAKSLLPN